MWSKWLLKEFSEVLAPVVTHLVNTSYQLGSVPTEWKTANICPIPKVSSPGQKNDWRPISLTSCLGKVQERLIAKKLIPVDLEECNNKKQHAYLPKHSTTNALVRASHTWLTETDSKQPIMVLVLLADMPKASDRVDHTKLLQHLASLCLCPRLLTWFHSCTTGRTQRVIANGMYCSWPEVTSGVPEVGIVSSYLFLLHMSTRRESSLRIHWTLAMPMTLACPVL